MSKNLFRSKMLGSFTVKRYKATKKEPPALFQYHLNNQVQRFQLFESDNLHVNRYDSQHLAKS